MKNAKSIFYTESKERKLGLLNAKIFFINDRCLFFTSKSRLSKGTRTMQKLSLLGSETSQIVLFLFHSFLQNHKFCEPFVSKSNAFKNFHFNF